ncbi:MAG: FAD-dependent oxidoreductase [Myxococcota bacterium]
MDCDVIVVGAGPVGLLLACRLVQLGVRVRVLERRTQRSKHSRAIGVHRPSLVELARLGLADRFTAEGVRVYGGAAVADGRELGSLRFGELGGPYPFALSLPQSDTERLLEQSLDQAAPGALRRGWEVTRVSDGAGTVWVDARAADGTPLLLEARYAVGCDGQHSLVREQAGIAFKGASYPDSFVMGDFGDSTSFGNEARLFLSREGLVESFPLPKQRRRWVVSTSEPVEAPDREQFSRWVQARTGCDLRHEPCTMLSAFGIERRLADVFVRGRVALAGDAAHVVSPIGGQGLNAGWMDAWDLAEVLARIEKSGVDEDRVLREYGRRARSRAKRVIRRAAFNTYLGRTTRLDAARNLLIRTALHTPARRWLARMFSMQGLMQERMQGRP